MRPVEMYKGERRVVTVEVSSCDPDPFTIRNPTYSFKKGSKIEDTGVPSVQEHELTMTLEPMGSGNYILECKMEIANEIIIRRLPVYVQS